MIKYNDPLFIQWNVDEDGNKISTEVLNEQHQIVENKITLTQIPDKFYRVQIDGYTEIDISEEIDVATKFKVNYLNGQITFHSSLDGQTITIDRYYGRGVILYPASRIYTETDSSGNITETLQDIINANKMYYQEPVATYADITTTYPTPEVGWTTQTLDDNKFYRWDGSEWKYVQKFDISNIQSQIDSLDVRVNTIESQNLDIRTTALENKVCSPDYSEPLTQTSSVFSVGTGKDSQGQDVDISSSVVEGQLNVVRLFGNTRTNLLTDNQASIETDITGFGPVSTGITLSKDTTEKVFGNASLKVVTDGTRTNQGARTFGTKVFANRTYVASLYVKAPSGDFQVLLRNGPTGSVVNSTAFTGTGSWQRVSISMTPTTDISNLNIFIRTASILATTFYIDGLMLEETDTAKSFITGTKSTVSTRLKVVGKNLVRNGNGEEGLNYWYDTVNATGTWDTNEKAFKVVSAANANVVSDLFKISPSKQYTISAKVKSDGVNDSFVAVQWYDKAGNFISSTQGNKVTSTTYATSTNLATPPKNAVIAKISLFNVNAHTAYFKEVQLEEGTTATEYEPYKESVAYITLPEGVDGLHSLPNGVKDKVTDSGKLIQKTKKYVLQASDIVSVLDSGTDTTIAITNEITDMITQTNSIDGSTRIEGWIEGINTDNSDSTNANRVYYTYSTNKKIRFILPYGTTLTDAQNILAGTTLIYQLSEPKTYDLNITPLNSYPNGTLIVEPYLRKAIKYNATTGKGLDFPVALSSIEKIEDVNGNEIDLANVTLAADGLSATITGAVDNEVYTVYGYIKTEESTIPETTHKVPINTSATIKDNNAMINKNSKNIISLQDQVAMLVLLHS